ncbi:SPOR domain-containing protein [Mucilaginibacter sabulilitoris]|uniref:SPOR domain-containing protein n=1 Tax=Mucilaginibacter sabulilitoris TaxID=1173583 RepID=A0ABZ0TQJ2_9SPHI|nr:SPOR domain-containing protein [Mucilaginibacter sabulilitoris]WPU93755.1 SPOR domain-containing protein [Mucilaginibacter sabulilitoris]
MKKAVFDHKANFSLIKYCFFFILLIASSRSFAQQTRGKVEVIKDPLVDTLIAKRLEMNNAVGVPTTFSSYGYRVQIFSGSNRKDAFNAQARLQDQYPELRTYIIYSEPNFKVRAGDFRTRLEAQKLMQELRSSFSSLFIISEKINLPKTESDND